jgi:hypothetical protein
MFERRKQRRQIQSQIEEVKTRIQRTAERGNVGTIDYAVAVSRWEIDRLDASLRQFDAEPWLEWAKRHRIKIPDDNEYWDAWQVDAAETQTVLSNEGKHYIKTAVREKRFRFMQRWGAIIAILTSILSLIISIIALRGK